MTSPDPDKASPSLKDRGLSTSCGQRGTTPWVFVIILAFAILTILMGMPRGFWDFNVLEVVATIAIGGTILFGFLAWLRHDYWKPARAYRFGGDCNVAAWPPAPAEGRGQLKVVYVRAINDTIFVRARTVDGVSIGEIDIRFVARRLQWRIGHPLSMWRWAIAGHVGIPMVIRAAHDADAELFKEQGISAPLDLDNQVGGRMLRYTNRRTLIAGDSLFLRLDVYTEPGQWQCHLEFSGPTATGKRAYRRIAVEADVSMPLVPHTQHAQ